MYVEGIPNVKFIKMRKLTIIIIAVWALFLTQEQKSQYIIIIVIV